MTKLMIMVISESLAQRILPIEKTFEPLEEDGSRGIQVKIVKTDMVSRTRWPSKKKKFIVESSNVRVSIGIRQVCHYWKLGRIQGSSNGAIS